MKLTAISTPHLNKINYTNVQNTANATTNSISQRSTEGNFGLYSQDIKCKISFKGQEERRTRLDVKPGDVVEVVEVYDDDYRLGGVIRDILITRPNDNYFGTPVKAITRNYKGNLRTIDTGDTSEEKAIKHLGLNIKSNIPHSYGDVPVNGKRYYIPEDGIVGVNYFKWNPENNCMEFECGTNTNKPRIKMKKHAAKTTANAEKRADKRLLERHGTQRAIERMTRQGLSADELEQIAQDSSGKYDKYEVRAAQELLKEM